MAPRWNHIATYFSGVLCAAILTLSDCSGGAGGSSSLPTQPSQQNPRQAAPAQTPLPSTTSVVRIYATNQERNVVNVYDEEGHQFANRPFPNLVQPFQIAFDSNNQRLYVTGFGPGVPLPVAAFDLNGDAMALLLHRNRCG